ncbi:DUF1499 domain-containing protein [Jiella sp. MQZ9-1]|uniref:DUF1499 domain-containing protein n=1 Tax=Jiella flava TaxID=2816857 RepID=A0A939G238_9HYPH|nr:DUF1499 domain-containing protein [Jiella flava]MBO0664480.1 DUF1499 domain-containing protein [Jiella flava]MCD2473116.1 DUF1499 domain-containing protein [Jiella flava]
MPPLEPAPRHRRLRQVSLLLCGGVVVATAGFFAIGPARVWRWAAGPADQGPIDFASLQRRSAPNDALACSPNLCSQPVDIVLPLFAVSPATLMVRLDALIVTMGSAKRVDRRFDAAYRRYVFRSAIFRFPDTLDARAMPTHDGRTALELYSRSLIGRGDFGVNRARLQTIATGLNRAIAQHLIDAQAALPPARQSG